MLSSKSIRVSHGLLVKFSHNSKEIGLEMNCNLFIPTGAPTLETLQNGSWFGETSEPNFPVLMYLSGLTCTSDNVCEKGGAPNEDESWDFGTGAGFYVDATTDGFKNYRMYSYCTKELPEFLRSEFPCLDVERMSITGHSMGGHGALQIALKNPDLFRSVSAFAPIAHPLNCAWGKKAFEGYLGSVAAGESYDATFLLASKGEVFGDILVDIGTADSFLADGQLQPEALEEAAERSNAKLTLRRQIGYDHSYYFVSTFLPEHIEYHAKRLISTRTY